MIRGMQRVVKKHDVKPGKFYLARSFDGATRLMQCVSSTRADGTEELSAVYFPHKEDNEFRFSPLPSIEMLVELPDLHVRIDPAVIAGSSFTKMIEPSTLILEEDQPLLIVPNERLGRAVVNLAKGVVVPEVGSHWLEFDKWYLVKDEWGEEIIVARFGKDPNEEPEKR